MRKIFFIFSLLACTCSIAQTVEIGTDLFGGQGAYIDDMIVTNSGEVFFAMKDNSANGEIEVHKFDGVSWSNTANTGTFVDSLCGNFQLLYNPLNDSIFLGYIKNDGFYLRSYTSSWSTAEYHSCSTSLNWQNDRMISAMDEPGNVPYFMFLDDSDDLKMLSFENSIFEEVLAASSGTFFIDSWSMVFNEDDGFIYFCHNNASHGIIERYNGIGWSDLDDNVTNLNQGFLGKSQLFYDSVTNEIICFYSYDSGSGTVPDKYGINKYNAVDNSKTIVMPEVANNAGILRGAAFLGDQYYADFSVEGYWGTTSNIIWQEALTIGLRRDLSFDNQGYLYWRMNVGTSENVYRSGPFVLGDEGLELNNQNTIYPNPASSQIQITSNELQSASFYSIDGALVAEGYEVSKTQPLNIDFLSKGMYVVKLTNALGEVSKQRIVVE
jgi:Secretion system C-terminal sorting domain